MLSAHEVVVDVTLYVGIVGLVLVSLLLVLLVIASAKPFLDFLGRKGERDVLRHTLESTEAALAIFGMCSHIGVAVLVQFVSVGGEHGVHVERIALPPL